MTTRFSLAPASFFFLVLVPIYWMIAVSLQKPDSLAGSIQLVPADPTFSNFLFILTEPDWYWGYINALTYV